MQFKITEKFGYLIIIAMVLCSASGIWAQEDDAQEPLFLFRGARPMGIGNAFEAVADDINALHYNPAGIAQTDETSFELLAIRPRVTIDLVEEVSTITDFFNDTIKPLTESDDPLTDATLKKEREDLVVRFDDILSKRLGLMVDLPSIGLVVPFHVSEYKAAVGSMFYTQNLNSIRVLRQGLPWKDAVKELLDDAVVYRVAFQWAFTLAGAVEIPLNQAPLLDKAYVGASFRYINRQIFTDADDPFRIEDVLNPDSFKEKYFDIEDDDFAQFASDNFKSQTGYTIDIGTILSPIEGVDVGLSLRNLINSLSIEEADESRGFPRNITLAVATKPFKLLNMENSMLDLTLVAAWNDPNGDDGLGEFKNDSFTDNIHLGAELVLLPKGWISVALRTGNNQGFLTFGVSLKLLKILDLNVLRYGDLEADWYVASLGIVF
ncbi:TPA: hypothetical protein EYP66_05765 [Candidatus Poribacteria bacterium]|nr:hypothetical protein [Candidatus Poribacteria bacterium]